MGLRNLAASLLLLAGTGSAAADEIRLAADTWCPYNCEPEAAAPGYMVEIARRAFESQGHKVVYTTMPWARALQDAETGKIAGVFGAVPEEAKGLLYPKETLGQSRNVLIAPAGSNFAWKSTASLEPHALGVILDYSYGETLDAYIKANAKNPARIQPMAGAEPLKANLRKLQAGRIALTVEDANVAAYELAGDKQSRSFRLIDLPDAPNPLYIGFAPNDPKTAGYARRLDETVTGMRASGELAKLLARYGLTDWDRKAGS